MYTFIYVSMSVCMYVSSWQRINDFILVGLVPPSSYVMLAECLPPLTIAICTTPHVCDMYSTMTSLTYYDVTYLLL